jgi:hypothetical protein
MIFIFDSIIGLRRVDAARGQEFRFLVALPALRDLLLFAKHLFVEAICSCCPTPSGSVTISIVAVRACQAAEPNEDAEMIVCCFAPSFMPLAQHFGPSRGRPARAHNQLQFGGQ